MELDQLLNNVTEEQDYIPEPETEYTSDQTFLLSLYDDGEISIDDIKDIDTDLYDSIRKYEKRQKEIKLNMMPDGVIELSEKAEWYFKNIWLPMAEARWFQE